MVCRARNPNAAPTCTTLICGDPFDMPEQKANICVTIPEAMAGDVMQALNRAGGLITNVTEEGDHSTAVDAAVPTKGLPGFRAWLEEYTKGQGRISDASL